LFSISRVYKYRKLSEPDAEFCILTINAGDCIMMVNGLFKLPKPGSKEMEELLADMYESYVNAKPSLVQNERIRPADQDFFDWLMEDKQSLEDTNKLFKDAGIEW